MCFKDLTIEQKTEATINYFKEKDKIKAKGQKDADHHIYSNCNKIKRRMKGERKVSIKD